MIKKIISSVLLLFCFSLCRLDGNEFYSEYWQKFFWKMWENDSYGLGTYIKIDTGNYLQNVHSMQFNEQFFWKTSESFSLELHYAYINDRSIVPNSIWKWQHRLELEANSLFHLPSNCLLKTRNRIEIRRVQAEPKTLYRLRQRTMLIIPFEDNSILKSFSVYNELFYNISTHLFTQERICPFQMTFKLSDSLEMDLFFLIRFINTETKWQKNAVLGTKFCF